MKKTSFSRVRYAWPVLALLVVMLLSACGGGGTGSNSNTASIDYSGTITIWHGWQGAYLQAKQAIFNQYMQLHPKVKIVLVNQPNIASKADHSGQSWQWS